MKVSLYTRTGCGLCDKVHVALIRMLKDIQFELEIVDIEADPAVYERYRDRIPVVTVDDQEVAAAPIDENQLRAALKR